MNSFFETLEDPNHPLLGPTLKGLQLWRIWQSGITPGLRYNAIHIIFVIFTLSEYAELWFIRSDIEMALRNLSVTLLSTICIVKVISFIYWQKHWRQIIEYVSDLEKKQLSKYDHTTDSIIKEYTTYSRRVTYFYWCLVIVTFFTVVTAPLGGYLSSRDYRYTIKNGSAPYPEILSSWVPFDRTRGFGYWVYALEHAAVCAYGAGVVANYDSNAVVLMSFFAGQLKLLSINCAKLFGDGDDLISYAESVKRIKECHEHHVSLVRISSNLNSLLSPVMFLYVIICSLMIFASAVQVTTDGTGNMQRIWIAEFLMALITQLFLYCWHSNGVLYMSDRVDSGVYGSAWWSQSTAVRRSVLLLGGQLRKRIVFTAGPFTDLTVPTFVAILKGSYSYYTLLSKKED